MDKTKLSATDKSGDAENVEQEIARRQVDIKMVQNVLLIWLDNNIDEKNEDCRNMVIQLRRVINAISTFTNSDECIEFIKNLSDHKICIIIPGYLGQDIVPQVHKISQVDSIFIFCGNKKRHEQWAKNWSKIKGVFTEIKPICEALKQASQQCEQNAISISFVPTIADAADKTLDRLDPMFMYTQIMKEILLTIKFEQKHFNEYIDYCRDIFAENEDELKNVDKLERQYHDETPIWWYTYECFLYPMLNRALRMSDVDKIIKMGFFIGDLHRHIEELHKEQFGDHQAKETIIVYRGQGLSKINFDQLMNTKGGLMSFNNFLSTSKNRKISLGFAHNALADPDLVGILFVMVIDPSKSTTPFASIIDVSYFKDKEDEILFSMHTVFRIHDIKSMDKNHRLFQVDLTLTGENDEDLRVLTDRIREETFPDEKSWYRLGSVLLKMGQSDKAEQVYQCLLDETTDESDKASIYHQIGLAKYTQKEYKDAITFYEKSLEIYKKILPPNHPDLAGSYNNIGSLHGQMRQYAEALPYFEKSHEIWQKSLPPNHPDLAGSYNNLGLVYNNMGEYSKTLSYYEKALEIRQQSLPPNHPDLAMSYNNIGNVYFMMADYSKARPFYERAVDIAQQSLPSNHPHLQYWKENLDRVK